MEVAGRPSRGGRILHCRFFWQAFHRERERKRATNQLAAAAGLLSLSLRLMPPLFCSFKSSPLLSSILRIKHLHSDQALPAHAAKVVKAADKVAGMSTAQLVSFLLFFFFCPQARGLLRERERERERERPWKKRLLLSRHVFSPLAPSSFPPYPSEGRRASKDRCRVGWNEKKEPGSRRIGQRKHGTWLNALLLPLLATALRRVSFFSTSLPPLLPTPLGTRSAAFLLRRTDALDPSCFLCFRSS